MKVGLAALQQTIENNKARAEGTIGGALSFLTWKPNEVHIVRFLTDDVITCNVYDFVQTNDGKAKTFLVDPEKEDYVAKYASPEPGLGWTKDYQTKALVPAKPRERTIGLVVLRELVPKEGGKFEVVDKLEDIVVGGKTYRKRTFAIIIQSAHNFWPSLIGCYQAYGTLTDRDYRIQRSGGGLDTTYMVAPLDPDPDLKDYETVKAFYGYGEPPRPQDDPDRFLFCPRTLQDWADYYSSEEWARRWLLPNGTDPQTPSQAYAAAAQDDDPLSVFAPQPQQGFVKSEPDEAQAPVAPSAQTDFNSLRARLQPYLNRKSEK